MPWSQVRALALLAIFSSWPFTSYIENNAKQLTAGDVGVITTLWGLTLVVASALAWSIAKVFRTPALHAAIPVAGATVLFMLFGAITAASGVAAYVVLVVAVVATLAFAARRERLRRPLIVFALVSSLFPLPLIAVHVAKRYLRDRTPPPPHAVWNEPLKIRPNVLHLIVDGYAHSTTLAGQVGLDNYGFHRELEKRGFLVVDRAASNYPTTYLSLASTLAMEYVALPGKPYSDRHEFTVMIRGAGPAVAGFRREGYSILHSGGGWSGSACIGWEDLCLNLDNDLKERLGEAGYKLVRRTPLRAWAGGEEVIAKRGGIESIQQALDSMYRRQPYYLFAHSLPPHPPFFLRADCTEREATGSLEGWTDKNGYRDAVLCVNRKILQLLDAVLARDRHAFIVLQADHGSAFHGGMWETKLDSWTPGMVEERFRTFLAIRAPESCRQWIDPELTGVNVLRLVVGCLQQRKPVYLPNRFFTATYEKAVDYGNVNELERGPW